MTNTQKVKTIFNITRSSKFAFLSYFLIFILITYLSLGVTNSLAQATFKNEFEQGALIVGKITDDYSKVYIDGLEVKLTEDGYFVFGISIRRRRDVAITYAFKDDSYIRKLYPVKQRSFPLQVFIYKEEYVPPETKIVKSDTGVKKYELSKKAEKKLKKEKKTVNAWLTNSDNTGFKTQFKWPLVGRITSKFGSRRVLNQTPQDPHYGVDIAPSFTRFVTTPADGTVVFTDKNRLFEGNMVIIDHGHGVLSGLYHMDKVHVDVGDEVKWGDSIGVAGNTGFSTGHHLHWVVGWLQIAVDPELLAGEMPNFEISK